MPATAELEWETAERAMFGQDPGVEVYRNVSQWFRKKALLRRLEEERIYGLNESTEADYRWHKNLLKELISEGRELLAAAQSNWFDANPEKITVECIEAAVGSLQDTLRGAYENTMTAEQKSELLRQVFGDVA